MLAEFISRQLQSVPERTTPQEQDPIVSVSLHRDKNFAFVEFHSTEDADIAICMDGIEFMGQTLKFRRPKDYQPVEVAENKRYYIPGIVSTQVDNCPDKVFIGGLPPHLTGDEVREFVASYGPLRVRISCYFLWWWWWCLFVFL